MAVRMVFDGNWNFAKGVVLSGGRHLFCRTKIGCTGEKNATVIDEWGGIC